MKPVLFFDIDGCFHPQAQAKLDQNQKIVRSENDGLFCWAEPFIDLIIKFPSLDLVCHSNWRKYLSHDELLPALPDEIAERTVGITDKNADRHEAIIRYCQKHEVKDFVVMDDDLWAFPHKYPNLIWLPEDKGLSLEQSCDLLQQRVRGICCDDKKPKRSPC